MDLQPPWPWWLIDMGRSWIWMAVIARSHIKCAGSDCENPSQNMWVSLTWMLSVCWLWFWKSTTKHVNLTWMFSSLDPVLNWSAINLKACRAPNKCEDTKTSASEYEQVFLIVNEFATSLFYWKFQWIWSWLWMSLQQHCFTGNLGHFGCEWFCILSRRQTQT